MTTTEYLDRVTDILETFDYPNMILEFSPEPVALAIANTVAICKTLGESPMMCAIIIWSMTMTQQIIPNAQKAVKH